jgi:hypothetical protein
VERGAVWWSRIEPFELDAGRAPRRREDLAEHQTGGAAMAQAAGDPGERALLPALRQVPEAVRGPEAARSWCARRLDLERDQLARAPRHEVDLALWCAHAAAEHAPTHAAESAGGEALAELAQLAIRRLGAAREQARRPGQR